jgi:hypothetical protein
MPDESNRKHPLSYLLDFSGHNESIEKIVGSDEITLSEMQRRLWSYICDKNIIVKSPSNVVEDQTHSESETAPG